MVARDSREPSALIERTTIAIPIKFFNGFSCGRRVAFLVDAALGSWIAARLRL